MQEHVYAQPKNSKYKPKPKSYASNDMKTILSIATRETGATDQTMPSEMFVATAEELNIGLPIQIQLEVVPEHSMGHAVNSKDQLESIHYRVKVVAVKARVKPGTTAFTMQEAKQQEHIINGTEDSSQVVQREIKFIEQRQKEEQEPNRFTGLEI